MVNIKLDKTGGLTEALALKAARPKGYGSWSAAWWARRWPWRRRCWWRRGRRSPISTGRCCWPRIASRRCVYCRVVHPPTRRLGLAPRKPFRAMQTGGLPMSRTVYVNGDYLPEEEAKVSVFDRGFLFADGVYEVTSVLDGKLIDFDGPCKAAAAVAVGAGDEGRRWRPRNCWRSTASW
jgi:hypothetical protein